MKPLTIIILVLFILHLFLPSIFAQDTTKSIAFKNNKPHKRSALLYQPDLSYQILKHMTIKQEASAGNAFAQHELGLRYLLGEGEKADTIMAAYWIKKAADKKLTEAAYNYGVFCLNGMGVDWDPFEAFNYFSLAAEQGMPEAEYALGSLYTDVFIVKKDYNKAYFWMKKASENGNVHATAVLPKLLSKIDINYIQPDISAKNNDNRPDTSNNDNNIDTPIRSFDLVFIDFTPNEENLNKTDNVTLLKDLALIRNADLKKSVFEKFGNDSTAVLDSEDFKQLVKFANYGCPEAITVLGRCYEEGWHLEKNIITALASYLRAFRNGSSKAPVLLHNILKDRNYLSFLKQRVDKNDPEAMYVWQGLFFLGYDNSITEKDAFNLLVRSASLEYLPSILELAYYNHSGKFVDQNKTKAIELLKEAEKRGSKEAMVGILTSLIFDNPDSFHFPAAFEKLQEAVNNGSLLAVIPLAHCYETGKGTMKSISNAVDTFRHAASRGNQFAYEEMLRIYNSKRPPGEKFQLEN